MSKVNKKNAEQPPRPDFRYVSPDDLLFDKTNPRFGKRAKSATQEELQDILMQFPHLASELVPSFVEDGYIPYEPLVVRQQNDKYIVIEGNRRLAAIQHIRARPDTYGSEVVERLNAIPVLLFHEKGDARQLEEIRKYLGIRHVHGYREWPPQSKAVFLDEQIKSGEDLERVMAELNLKRHHISRYLIPFRVKQTAQDILDEADWVEDRDFWVLGEALARSDIKGYIKLDVDPDSLQVKSFDKTKFKYLLEFLYGSTEQAQRGRYRAIGSPRITETRQLSRLARVLSSGRARQELEKGSTLSEAELYVEPRDETITALLEELRVILQRILQLSPSHQEAQKVAELFDNFDRAVAAFAKDDKGNQ